MIQKKYFTLLELLVALALSSLLISGLLGFYHYITTVGGNLEKSWHQVEENQYAHFRLNHIFAHLECQKKSLWGPHTCSRAFKSIHYTPKHTWPIFIQLHEGFYHGCRPIDHHGHV